MPSEFTKQIKQELTKPETWNPFCHGTSTRFQEDIEENGLKPRQCTDNGECRPSIWEDYDSPRGQSLESEPDRVYLADQTMPGHFKSICYDSASLASEKFGGEPIIFPVCLENKDEEYLVPDEDAEALLTNPLKQGCLIEMHAFNTMAEKDDEFWEQHDRYDHPTDACGDFIHMESWPDGGRWFTEKVCKPLLSEGGPSVDEDFTKDDQRYLCSDLPEWVRSLFAIDTVAYQDVIPPERLNGPWHESMLTEDFYDKTQEFKCNI